MTDTSQAAACPTDSSPSAQKKAIADMPLFALGQVLVTPGASELLEAHQLTALPFVRRHVSGDWGDVCSEDRQSNTDALQNGYRLMSVYVISKSERLWIITEADRSSTTLLSPEEY